jgi:hypothetical protein
MELVRGNNILKVLQELYVPIAVLDFRDKDYAIN